MLLAQYRRSPPANAPAVRSPHQRPGVTNEILDGSFCAQLCRYAADFAFTRTPSGVVRSQAAQPSRTSTVGMPGVDATMNSASYQVARSWGSPGLRAARRRTPPTLLRTSIC
jgi:hypothetical protein